MSASSEIIDGLTAHLKVLLKGICFKNFFALAKQQIISNRNIHNQDTVSGKNGKSLNLYLKIAHS